MPRQATIALDEPYLLAFGELLIPINIWRALVRFDAWIEPALIAEWLRLMDFYGERHGRRLEDQAIARAMAWSEPTREVAVVRQRALDLLGGDRKVFCVWSGRRHWCTNRPGPICAPMPIAVNVLNRMLELGHPKSGRIA